MCGILDKPHGNPDQGKALRLITIHYTYTNKTFNIIDPIQEIYKVSRYS